MSSRPCHRQTFPVAPVPWVHTHGSMLRSLRNYSCSLLTHRGLTPTALSPGPYGTFRALSHLTVGWCLRLYHLVPTELFVLLTHSPWADAHGFITWSLRNYSCSLLTHRGLTPTALSPGPYGTFRALSRL